MMISKINHKNKRNHFETSPKLAEVKVSYRSRQNPKIRVANSKEVFDILYPLYDQSLIEYQELFFLLLLNRANSVLGWIKLSSGGTSGTVVDPKIVFAIALQTNTSGIILSHNHPSGNLKPSQGDIAMTKKINNAGHLLEIKLLDHIIVNNEGVYYSFADEGMLSRVSS
jgi:DNA repair protein RadC